MDLRAKASYALPPRLNKPKKSLAEEVNDATAANNAQVGAILAKADNNERKLKEKELKLKHASKRDILNNKADIEKDYLEAIHAKIGMLNKID